MKPLYFSETLTLRYRTTHRQNARRHINFRRIRKISLTFLNKSNAPP